LLIEQGALVAFAFDPAKRAVSPEPTVVAPGFGSGLGAAAFSTSGNGVLAYRTGGGQQRQLKWVDRAGRALGAIGEPGSDALAGPELSPDGRTLAVFRQPQSSNDIWLIDLARSVPTRLTTSPAASASPLWAADGKKLFFTSRREGANGVFQQEVSGGDATLAVPAPYRTALCASPDGRYLVVLRAEGDATRADLFSVDLQGDRKPVPLVQTRFDDTEAQISPDGRWLAFVSNEAGRAEVYLQPFPAGGGRVQVSAAGGAQVRWAPSGKEIFYVAPDGRMTAVPVRLTAGAAPELGAPSALFSTSLATGTNVLGNKPQYVVARDGRFLLNATVGDAPTPPIVVVVNWQAGLSK
jgi:dipeptidyl aminopeptidase/acylaminoacyl peptidase